jgi:hypothetical protein
VTGVTTIVDDLIVDTDTLFVDVSTDRVGINTATPTVALDVVGSAAISGTLGVTGNSTLSGNLSVDGNTTLGNASGDNFTINGNAVSIPNGLNIDSDTFVIDATNNRVGIRNNNPNVPLTITADQSSAQGIAIRGRNSDSISAIDHYAANGTSLLRRNYVDSGGTYYFANSGLTPLLAIASTGQLNAVIPGGSTLYPGYLCRAWVNFNGTGTVAIRASGNVSSITDNGVGDYTINFTNPMPDANYNLVGGAGSLGNQADVHPVNFYDSATAPTTAFARILCATRGSALTDQQRISVAIFR